MTGNFTFTLFLFLPSQTFVNILIIGDLASRENASNPRKRPFCFIICYKLAFIYL